MNSTLQTLLYDYLEENISLYQKGFKNEISTAEYKVLVEKTNREYAEKIEYHFEVLADGGKDEK